MKAWPYFAWLLVISFSNQSLHAESNPESEPELRIQVAAEWSPPDLTAVGSLVLDGALSLDGLVTHRYPAADAAEAYHAAFHDPDCVKMTLDWSTLP